MDKRNENCDVETPGISFDPTPPTSEEEIQSRTEWYQVTRGEIVGGTFPIPPAASETRFKLEEVERAYQYGLFFATIYLCAAILEDIIQKELVNRDKLEDEDKCSLGRMAAMAENEEMITAEEAKRIRDLHQERTDFFHFRDLSQKDAPTMKWLQEARQGDPSHIDPSAVYDFQEERAREGLEILFELVKRPFGEWPADR